LIIGSSQPDHVAGWRQPWSTAAAISQIGLVYEPIRTKDGDCARKRELEISLARGLRAPVDVSGRGSFGN
jgi:hypothetical protein